MQPSWRLTKPLSPVIFLEHLTSNDCHPQEQSILFGRLPAELRNVIFKLAISPYEDLSCAFDESSSLWRPGFRGPIRMDLSLLQTCRLAFYEAGATVMQNVELHCFASTSNDPAKAKSYGVTAGELRPLVHRINRLSPKQNRQLESLHLYPHSFGWAASGSLRYMFELDLPIKTVTMSFGSTVWRDWEVAPPDVAQLLDPLANYKLPNTLDEFALAFDVQEQYKPQLEAILTAAGEWEKVLQNGTHLFLDKERHFDSWKGKAKKSARLRDQPSKTVAFCTGTIIWRRSPAVEMTT